MFTLFSVILFVIISVLFYIHYLSNFVFKPPVTNATSATSATEEDRSADTSHSQNYMHKLTNNPNIVFLYTVMILWILCMGLLLFYLFAYYSVLINIHISNESLFVMDPYLHSLGETYLSHEIQQFDQKPSDTESALLTSIAYYTQHPEAALQRETFETASTTTTTTTTSIQYFIGIYMKYFSLILRLVDSFKKHGMELGELVFKLLFLR